MLSLLLATAAKTKTSGSDYGLFLVIIVIYAAAYFLYFRPRQKRNRALRTETKKFDVGDRVRTIGGLVGRVHEDRGRTVVLEGVDGTKHEYVREAIQGRHVDPDELTDGAMPDESTDDVIHDDDTDPGAHD